MATTRRAKRRCRRFLSYRNKNKAPDKALNESLTKPDCVICLEKIASRGKLSVCDHWFCFPCIYEWSKNTNTCPLCKERFRCITKIGMLPSCSPSKNFRIKDKNQRIFTDSDEDRELAYAMAEDISSDSLSDPEDDEDYSPSILIEPDSTFQEQRRRLPLRSFGNNERQSPFEDSFIDDSDGIGDSTCHDSELSSSSSEDSCSSQHYTRTQTISTRSRRASTPLLASPAIARPSTSNDNGSQIRLRNRSKRKRNTDSVTTRASIAINHRHPQASLDGWIDMGSKVTRQRVQDTSCSDDSDISESSQQSTNMNDILATPINRISSGVKNKQFQIQNKSPMRDRLSDCGDYDSSGCEKDKTFSGANGYDLNEFQSPTIVSRSTKRTRLIKINNNDVKIKEAHSCRDNLSNSIHQASGRRRYLDISSDESSDEDFQPVRRKRSRKRF